MCMYTMTKSYGKWRNGADWKGSDLGLAAKAACWLAAATAGVSEAGCCCAEAGCRILSNSAPKRASADILLNACESSKGFHVCFPGWPLGAATVDSVRVALDEELELLLLPPWCCWGGPLPPKWLVDS